jgi:hypothetical protein
MKIYIGVTFEDGVLPRPTEELGVPDLDDALSALDDAIVWGSEEFFPTSMAGKRSGYPSFPKGSAGARKPRSKK